MSLAQDWLSLDSPKISEPMSDLKMASRREITLRVRPMWATLHLLLVLVRIKFMLYDAKKGKNLAMSQ